MKTYITNGTLLTPNLEIPGGTVVIENGIIVEIYSEKAKASKGSMVVDAGGAYITPGFIDVHFHGALGKDTMDADPQSLHVLSNYCAQHGVTSFYPTTWSASSEDILAAITAVKQVQPLLQGARALGVHVEGPYIDLHYRGAQLLSMVRTPDRDEYIKWFNSGIVKLITCAPEIPGGFEFVNDAVNNGICISIGHSQATYDDVLKAADLGASQSTHIFNGMLGLHHREPGTVGGVLSDERIYVQMICDGVHLHPAIVKLIANIKSPSRVILITDAIRGTGLPDGDYDFKGQEFSVRDAIARTPDGGLSGSTLTLDEAFRRALSFTGKPITEILPMATITPAMAMGIQRKKGRIEKGRDADIVILNQDFCVEKTFVRGECVFGNN